MISGNNDDIWTRRNERFPISIELCITDDKWCCACFTCKWINRTDCRLCWPFVKQQCISSTHSSHSLWEEAKTIAYDYLMINSSRHKTLCRPQYKHQYRAECHTKRKLFNIRPIRKTNRLDLKYEHFFFLLSEANTLNVIKYSVDDN